MAKIPEKGKVEFLTNRFELNHPDLVKGAIIPYTVGNYYATLMTTGTTMSIDLHSFINSRFCRIVTEDRNLTGIEKEIDDLNQIGYRDG